MAHIVYGLSGEGFGHSARSYEVIQHLIKKNHQVLVLTYGKALLVMQKDFQTIEIPGLRLNYQNNELSYPRTFFDNAAMLVKTSREWPTLFSALKKFKPDMVISDYEPISAAIANWKKIPLISFDNQHQLTNTKITVPKKYRKDLLAAKMLTKSMVWGADYYLITSFFKTPITKPKTFLFPPVVREKIRRLKPITNNFILVYQNSDFDYIIDELHKVPKQKFVVFSSRPKEGIEKNITFKRHDPKTFITYLKKCQAIIGTAGLSLISEALYLKKPYFALPIAHQVEQVINALYLKKMGFGSYSEKCTATQVKSFLANLKTYRKKLEQHQNEGSTALFKKIDTIINSFTQ